MFFPDDDYSLRVAALSWMYRAATAAGELHEGSGGCDNAEVPQLDQALAHL